MTILLDVKDTVPCSILNVRLFNKLCNTVLTHRLLLISISLLLSIYWLWPIQAL